MDDGFQKTLDHIRSIAESEAHKGGLFERLIVNDPNGWFDDPRDLIVAIRRVVHVSVESARIIEGLPDPTSD